MLTGYLLAVSLSQQASIRYFNEGKQSSGIGGLQGQLESTKGREAGNGYSPFIFHTNRSFKCYIIIMVGKWFLKKKQIIR